MRRCACSWLKSRSVRSNRCDDLLVGVCSSYSSISSLLRLCCARAKGRVLAEAKIRGISSLPERSRASAAEGVVATRSRAARIASRRSVGYCRAYRAYQAQAPEKGAHGHQRPCDEARKTGTDHRRYEQGTAGCGGEGMLVGLKRSPALLEEGDAHPGDGGPRPRAATDDPAAHPAIAVVHFTVGTHPSVLPGAFQADFPSVGEVLLEQLLHLRGKAGVFRYQLYLPVGNQATEIEVRRSYLRPPSVGHNGLGVDHRATVLEDAHTGLQELPVAGA